MKNGTCFIDAFGCEEYCDNCCYFKKFEPKDIETKIEYKEGKTKGYLANGLFSLSDRLLNELLAKEIRKAVDVDLYVPQENMTINNKNRYADSKQIYKDDYNYLKEVDFLVCVIDGADIDSGTSAEIGIISTMNKKVYALYTDTRQLGTSNTKKISALMQDPTENQFMYKNLFVVGLIKKHGYIFNNIENLVTQLKRDLFVEGNEGVI